MKRKLSSNIVLSVIIIFVYAGGASWSVRATDGEIDSTFVQPDVLTYGGEHFEELTGSLSITRQSNGKIVGAGSYIPGGGAGGGGDGMDFAVFRFNPEDGSLDSSFGDGDGIVHFGRNDDSIDAGNEACETIILQTVGGDPDYILVGARGFEFDEPWFDYLVARVTPDGELDTSFGGGDGMVLIGYDYSSPGEDNITDLAWDEATGKIAVVGNTMVDSDKAIGVALLDQDGNLDPSFGDEGTLTISLDEAYDIAAYAVDFDSDHNIIFGGYTRPNWENKFLLVKLDQTGAPALSFGDNGLLILEDIEGKIMDIRCDGTDIIVFGSKDNKFKFAKLDADGNLYDGVAAFPEFGNGGRKKFNFGISVEASVMEIDSSGRIWGAGCETQNGNYAVARLLSDGSRDLSFGPAVPIDNETGGKVIVADTGEYSNSNEEHCVGLSVDPEGSVVLSGRSVGDESGYSLARVQQNGVIDSSLSQPGVAADDYDSVHAHFTVMETGRMADGGVIFAGTQDSTGLQTVLRMNPDGLFDGSFGFGVLTGIHSNLTGTTGFNYLGHA